ncbi:MAG: F0F1 ATP synthase subunit epsilon [Flavobacteriales bacterium]|nr:F0F1 ATP synthase subunit epsilon [Flavobacteriales bacterium]MCB9179403.1 F0F1 ATP synthase subunit epsilon [Flavobacteriales bacterium]HPF91798.1 F0F1 ATP synthase subunit epsilon [Flavobacteriales bacterium]
MRVEIITPDKELFKGEASYVGVPGVDGSMGFLNNHAPLITVLRAGDVKVKTAPGSETGVTDLTFPVKGGVVEVSNNTVIVLAE